MGAKRLYHIRIEGKVVEIEPGRWRARTETWGLTAYGATPEEAAHHILDGAFLFAEVVAGRGLLERELEKRAMTYDAYPITLSEKFLQKFDRGVPAPKVTPAPDGGEFTAEFVIAA